MAEYEPFPTGANQIETDRRLGVRLLGCFGLGGLSVGAMVLMGVILVATFGAAFGGCEVDLGDPGAGTRSQRLPVTLSPRTGLTDGATVRVTSDAFDADEIIGVAVCLRAADTERRGVDACDEVQGARYATDSTGHLDATYPVPRVITVGSKAYDCAGKARRCLVVAADANDYDRSGGQAITFQAGLPRVELRQEYERPESDHLPVGSQPALDAGPVAAGTEVQVLASGFQPGEPLLIAYCTAELEQEGVVDACEPDDPPAAVAAVAFRTIGGDLPRADASGAFSVELAVRPWVLPYGSDQDRALEDLSGGSGRSSTTSTTAPPEDAVACTAANGGCSIVIAAAADTKRSAILSYVVDA